MTKQKAEGEALVDSEVKGCALGERSTESIQQVGSTTVDSCDEVTGVNDGVPANPVTENSGHVAAREVSTADRFWLLLAKAGYEVW